MGLGLYYAVNTLIQLFEADCNEALKTYPDEMFKNYLQEYVKKSPGLNHIWETAEAEWQETMYLFWTIRGVTEKRPNITVSDLLERHMHRVWQMIRETKLESQLRNLEGDFTIYLKSLPPDVIVGEANRLPLITGDAYTNIMVSSLNIGFVDPVSVFLYRKLGLRVTQFDIRLLVLENGDTAHNPALALNFNQRLNALFKGPVTAKHCLYVLGQREQEVWAFGQHQDEIYDHAFYRAMREAAEWIYKPLNPKAVPLLAIFPETEELLNEYKQLMEQIAAGAAMLFPFKEGRIQDDFALWLIKQGNNSVTEMSEEKLQKLIARALFIGICLGSKDHPNDYWHFPHYPKHSGNFFRGCIAVLRSIFCLFTDEYPKERLIEITIKEYEPQADKKRAQIAKMWTEREKKFDR